MQRREKCEICGLEFSSRGIRNHVAVAHEGRIPSNRGKPSPTRGRTHTAETRKKLSESMKKAHTEGRNPGWAHINSDPSRMSRPEKYFNTVFNERKTFDKYDLKIHYQVGRYFLDFAFVDLGVDLEIDGSQHYRSSKEIEHDRKRDEYLRSLGWKIYRICWSDFCRHKDEEIAELFEYLKNVDGDRYYEIPIKKIQRTRQEAANDRHAKYLTEQEPKAKNLLKSGIDFSKRGWVGKAAKLIGISPQKTREWISKNCPELLSTANTRQTINSTNLPL